MTRDLHYFQTHLRELSELSLTQDVYVELYDLMEEAEKLGSVDWLPELITSIFEAFERYPLNDELGQPGPLVHFVEGTIRDLEELSIVVLDSTKRQPSQYGIWMINRLLNAVKDESSRKPLVQELARIVNAEQTEFDLKEQAAHYLDLQKSR